MADTPGAFQGKLLVAKPSLVDPNFSRTVVFLLAHGEQGALGLVLNRPTVTPLAHPLPEWGAAGQLAIGHLRRWAGERGHDLLGPGQVRGFCAR